MSFKRPAGGGGGSGITTLNTLTATTQTFAVGTSGTDFAIVSVGSTHTFNMPNAGASERGVVSPLAQTFGGDKTFADDIIGDILKAVGAGGWTIKNSAGSDVALFGAGGSTGTSLLGTTNIGSASADYVQVTGGTGNATFTATGSSTDINIAFAPKGTGYVTSAHGFQSLATTGSSTDVDYSFGGSANLGFVRPSSNTLDCVINGTVAWRINASRNMTIGGTSAPPNTERLFVLTSSTTVNLAAQAIQTSSANGFAGTNFYDSAGTLKGVIGFANSGVTIRTASQFQIGTSDASDVFFYTNNTQRHRISDSTRRMQLDSGLALPTTENTQTGTQTAIATLGIAGIRFTGALTNIQGFADGSTGAYVKLINLTGGNITVEHEDASATAANRIVTSTGADVTWAANTIAEIWYMSSTSRWYFGQIKSA